MPTQRTRRGTKAVLAQEEVDRLLSINAFIEQTDAKHTTFIEEIKNAILDSGKLTIMEWKALRARLKEIERLIPHIDLIIDLIEER